eukprot:460957-Prymnesium_polylepis.1
MVVGASRSVRLACDASPDPQQLLVRVNGGIVGVRSATARVRSSRAAAAGEGHGNRHSRAQKAQGPGRVDGRMGAATAHLLQPLAVS